MPNYEYEIVNRETGEVRGVVTVPLPVGERDAVELRRVEVPRTLCVCPYTPLPAQMQASDVLRAYNKAEQRIGNNAEFARRIGHSADQVKAAWGNELPVKHHH